MFSVPYRCTLYKLVILTYSSSTGEQVNMTMVDHSSEYSGHHVSLPDLRARRIVSVGAEGWTGVVADLMGAYYAEVIQTAVLILMLIVTGLIPP